MCVVQARDICDVQDSAVGGESVFRDLVIVVVFSHSSSSSLCLASLCVRVCELEMCSCFFEGTTKNEVSTVESRSDRRRHCHYTTEERRGVWSGLCVVRVVESSMIVCCAGKGHL